jgi:hypothetical protein
VQDCVRCPAGTHADGCTDFTRPCRLPSGCCPPDQDPCFVFNKFCCPPGSSCCNSDTNLCCSEPNPVCCISTCCAASENCCSSATGEGGFCCPGDQACTLQGCCPQEELPCGGQCCARVLSPGSDIACCNGKCTDTNTDPNNCGGCAGAGGKACIPPPGAAAICVEGKCDFVCNEFGLTKCASQCCCAINPPQVIATPSSSNNYLLAVSPTDQFGCNPIEDLKVSFAVTQDMVAAVTPPGGGPATQNGGFTMQLNAYNPAGPTTSWMQYVFLISGNAIQYQVQYWDIATACACGHSVCDCTPPLVNLQGTVLSLPSNTVPANYVLEIDLNNDVTGNITGALFSVTDNTGKTTSSLATLDANHQFPIVAFQTNFGGPGNGSNSVRAAISRRTSGRAIFLWGRDDHL